MVTVAVTIAEFKAVGNVIVLLLEEFQHVIDKCTLTVVMELWSMVNSVMMETTIDSMDVITVR